MLAYGEQVGLWPRLSPWPLPIAASFLGEAVDWLPAVHPVVVLAGMSVGLVTGFVSVARFPRD